MDETVVNQAYMNHTYSIASRIIVWAIDFMTLDPTIYVLSAGTCTSVIDAG